MTPSFSVIVPAYGEQRGINALVDHIRTVGYGRDVQILVADGHPHRTTLTALERPGVLPVACPPGRARQMNAAARQAEGDVLLFLHADCRLPARAFESMTGVLARGCAGGAFGLAIASPRWSLRLIAWAATIRSRLTSVPYGDQGIFLRRDAFLALGGYADLPFLEDVDLMRRARCAGLRLGVAAGRVATSPRRWEAEGVWRRTFTNWLIIALYLCGVPPERLAALYRPRPEPKEST